MDLVLRILHHPKWTLMLVTGTCILALMMALVAEHVFGLAPCIMCIYQRIPFAIVVFLGLLSILRKHMVRTSLFLSAIAMGINTVLAFYHTGIERKWWASAVEGCKVSFDQSENPEDLLAALMAAPTARCDEIPWADPILGLSMANYNIILCLGLTVICIVSLRLLQKKSQA